MDQDGNDFIMGGGIPSFSWANKPFGTEVSGVVQAPPQTRRQTDMATKEPKFFKNGDSMMQSVIRIQTDLRDATVEHDDGQRQLFIKGADISRLRRAVQAAGAKKIEPGGWLKATYVRDELPTGGLPQGAKVREFVYVPPSVTPEQGAHAASPTTLAPQGYTPPPQYPQQPTTYAAATNWAPATPPAPPPPAQHAVASSAPATPGSDLLDTLNEEQRAALKQLGYNGI